MIKAVFFDVDWTLYDHKAKRFVPSALEAIKQIKKKGVKVFLCSARPYHSLLHFGCFDLGIHWDGYIASAGGYAVVGKKTIKKITMDKKDVRHLQKEVLEKGLNMEVITPRNRFLISPKDKYVDEYYSIFVDVIPEVHRYHDGECTGCLLFAPEEYDDYFKSKFPHLSYYRFFPIAVDMQAELHEKGKAIADVLEYLDIKKEEAAGFGDDFQDISMKDACGIFIAMGNGKEEVKKHAHFVTKPIDEDGVAHGLERIGLL